VLVFGQLDDMLIGLFQFAFAFDLLIIDNRSLLGLQVGYGDIGSCSW
jgi:hypothetical protein